MRKLEKIIIGCVALGASTLGIITGNFLSDHYNKEKINAPFYVNYFEVNGQTFVEYSDRQSKEGMRAVAFGAESGEINLEREETYEGGIFNLGCPDRECAVYAIDSDGFKSEETIIRRGNRGWSRVE